MTKHKKQSTDWLTIRAFLQAGRKYPRAFYITWLTPVSSVCLSILMPYYVGRILAGLARSSHTITASVVGLVVSGIVAIAINRISFTYYLSWQAKVMADLQTIAMKHLLYRGTSFHNDHIGGKLVSDVTDYPNAFLRLTDNLFVSTLPFLAILVTGITIIMIQAPIIGLTVLLMSILAISSAVLFRLRMAPNRHKRLLAGKAVTGHIADTISNNQTVKAFGQEDFEIKQHTKLNNTLLDFRMQDWHQLATNGNNRIIGLFLFEIVFVIAIVHQIQHHPALLATGIFAFSYTVTLTNRLFDIGNMMRQIEEGLLQAEPMTEMMQESIEIVDAPDAPDLAISTGAINFSDVNFHYTDNNTDAVFKNLDLQIEPGQKIGLVGPSGGGKSTLTKLLLRFEDISSGAIIIDGQDIAQVTQQSLHQAIGYVAQEPLLFHRTIAENIVYGKLTANTAAIKQAAAEAYALDFIEALPKQFDTVVGERGVKLSGGQRQRVAIARAMLKDAPILVLDEATSALDSESEKVIQEALWKLMEGKTAIVIAHRLSTIQRLDRIIVLDGGKIVEDGTHAELLKQKGLYAKLWTHQSGGFIED